DKEIPLQLRTRYQNYIENELPKLAGKIDAKWQATGGGGGSSSFGSSGSFGGAFGSGSGMRPGQSFGSGPPKDDEKDFVVIWNPQNQGQLASRFDWSKQAPNTLQILYAQEDFWVLDALLDIVAKTNEGADANYKAAIKSIDAIDIGAAAAG